MPRPDRFSLLFVVVSTLAVAGRYFGLIPEGTAVVLVALGGVVWTRPLPRGAVPWSRHALLGGLALLAVAQVRPAPILGHALTAAGCAAIGAGVLARSGRPRGAATWVAAGLALLVIAGAVVEIRDPIVMPWEVAPDMTIRTAAAVGPVVAVIVVGSAVVAALARGGELRWAGVGLVPVLVLALSVLPALLSEDGLGPRPSPAIPRVETPVPAVPWAAPPGSAVPWAAPPVPEIPAPAGTAGGISTYTGVFVRTVGDEAAGTTDPGAAFRTAMLLLGLAALTTSLFPYRV